MLQCDRDIHGGFRLCSSAAFADNLNFIPSASDRRVSLIYGFLRPSIVLQCDRDMHGLTFCVPSSCHSVSSQHYALSFARYPPPPFLLRSSAHRKGGVGRPAWSRSDSADSPTALSLLLPSSPACAHNHPAGETERSAVTVTTMARRSPPGPGQQA